MKKTELSTGCQQDKGAFDKGRSGEGMPEIQNPRGGEGITPSASLEKSSNKLVKKGALNNRERLTIGYWQQSGGDYQMFLEACGRDKSYIPVLFSNKVKRFIEQESEEGRLASLIANKDEIEAEMTQILRGRMNSTEGKINAAKQISKMRGYEPKDNVVGGVQVNLQIIT